MADYYPLLSRAIAGLAGRPESDRHAIYGRAREALERQLRGFEPPLGDEAIRAELAALEETIARIEDEQNGRSAEALPTAPPAPSEPKIEAKFKTEPESEIKPDSGAESGSRTELKPSAAPDAAARIDESIPPVTPAARITGPSPFKASRPTVNDLPPPQSAPVPPTPTPEALSEAEPDAPVRDGDLASASGMPGTAPEPMADASMDDVTIQPMLRPRMPTRRAGETDTRKKPLALFAGIAIVAMAVMGLIALSRRDGPDLAKTPPIITAPESNPDASKTEGRLAGTDAPAKPVDPTTPPKASGTVQTPATKEDGKAAQGSPPGGPAAGGSTVAAVTPTNRAFMVLEVAGGAPNQFEGKVIWTFGPDPALKGQKSLRAGIEFPSGGLSIDFSIARNVDAGINASHTVMVIFDPKVIDPIREMSAVEWRERESQAGTVLSGIVVPVQDNVFMIGLDKTDTAIARNLDLLRTQKWMVFEVRLVNGRRGAILVEKGAIGEKAIADALADWK
ncbi:MAG: putative CheA signal transduction histidine [Beijerinckiaceae bacterium]|nr:MAG: putative CheA signal transduction histidine [Beijerinckiaceae bacterium]